MESLLILLLCLLHLIQSENTTTTTTTTTTTSSEMDWDAADCECITGWTTTDIDCSSSQSNIHTLESYLTLNETNCFQECHNDFQCQQAFSLLTQYYDYCSLGTVSEVIIRSYRSNSSCNDCYMNNKYTSSRLLTCSSINCINDQSVMLTSIDYIESHCSLIEDENTTNTVIPDNYTSNPNPTLSPTPNECSTDCQRSYDNIASYQRRCRTYEKAIDYQLLDTLYMNDYVNCQRDCNIPFDTEDNAMCSSPINKNYSQQLSISGKLDIASLERETKYCFYGLNINDPTSYDLICIEKQSLSTAGIINHTATSDDTNTSYWAAFGIATDMDQVWVLLCGAIIFFMQLGFSLLESGAVKAGNVQNILFKNVMDAAICCITWWIVGYCVAYGNPSSPDSNGFMGVENILIESETWSDWFFQMSFACTASTIVSGAVAERVRLEPYFIYTIVVSCWIYPVAVHWIWSETGWLSPRNINVSIYGGAVDFAGSSVVHMIGGFCGLCGAYFVGPRLRRFDTSKEATSSKYYKELMHQFEFGHNVPFQVLGLLILWFGFYAFNPGSTLAAQNNMDLASLIAVNTTLSAATGGVTSALFARWRTKSWHIPKLVNGILAALASITASCGVVKPGFSILIGFIGSLLYYGASTLMVSKYIQIDDPLDAFAVHGVGGMWGVLSASLFATSDSLEFANYPKALYEGTNVGERIATNLVLILVIIGWTVVNSSILFGVMSYLKILRVTEGAERTGIDIKEHGGSAVNMRTTYAVSAKIKSKIHDKQKYHTPFTRDVAKSSGSDNDHDSDEENIEKDGNFDNKVRESSLEKRLDGIAEDDEDGVFPT